MSQILKNKHTLVGKNIIPVMLALRADSDVGEFNRLKKEHPLEAYSIQELTAEFEKLTGESVRNILVLAGKDETLENMRLLLHYAIGHANTVGAPKGQNLVDPHPASRSASGSNSAGSSSVSGTLNHFIK